MASIPLFDLFPLIIRYKDSLALGSPDAEGTLRKITYALEQEAGLTAGEIQELTQLLNVDSCPSGFLLHLSHLLGTRVGPTSLLGDDYPRWLIRNLTSFYKIKGTHFSWSKRFGYLLRTGVDSNLYRAWELWKAIPYELGDYSRYLDYTHRLRAARFDLYYLDGSGNPAFLAPSDAEPYVEQAEDLRPVHVILRHLHRSIDIEDTITSVTDVIGGVSPPPLFSVSMHFSEEVSPGPTDSAVDFEDIGGTDLLLPGPDFEIECTSSCETGCEGYCESTCEWDACEFVCQAGCQFSSEMPDCELDCESSCEGGSCEGGCQIGSCQSGCQGCIETEIFPAYVHKIYPTDAEPRILPWFPYEGSFFPPTGFAYADWTGTDWWIQGLFGPHPNGALLYYDKIGVGAWSIEDPELHTWEPPLWEEDWILTRCVKGEEFSEVHGAKGDGTNVKWSGDLSFQPHPCSVRAEARLDEVEVGIAPDPSAGDLSIRVADSSGFNIGDKVQIHSDNHAESNTISNIDGDTLLLACPLRFNHSDNPAVTRPLVLLEVHTNNMSAPVSNTEWLGLFTGDVSPGADNYANYRNAFHIVITFKQPPPNGATITIFYYKEEECQYWWTESASGNVKNKPVLLTKDDGVPGGDPDGDGADCTYTYTIKTLDDATIYNTKRDGSGATAENITPQKARIAGTPYTYAGETYNGVATSRYGIITYDDDGNLLLLEALGEIPMLDEMLDEMLDGRTFLVRVTEDGTGVDGPPSTWKYNVKDLSGNTLDTGVTPEKARMATSKYTKAGANTYGIAGYNGDTLILLEAFEEVPQTNVCP